MFLINGDKFNFSLINPHCVLPVDQVIFGALEMSSSVVFGQHCVFCAVRFSLWWIHGDEQQLMPEIPEDPQLITSDSSLLVSLLFKAEVCNFCEKHAKIMNLYLPKWFPEHFLLSIFGDTGLNLSLVNRYLPKPKPLMKSKFLTFRNNMNYL